MKILFVTHYFYPEGNAPATRVFEMARRWVKAGHDVTVVTAAPNVPSGVVYDGYENRWLVEEDVEGVKVIRVWTFLAANAGTRRRITSYLSFMVTAALGAIRVDRPDVVIATSPQFFCGWAGLIAAKARRLPFVLEVRDIWPESILAVGAMKESPTFRFLRWLERRLYAGAAGIVTVGEPYRDQLVERGVPRESITITPNGVDLNTYRKTENDAASSAFRAEFGLGERFVCAYVGTIGMAAGLDVVLRASRLLEGAGRDDVCFLLIGDGANRAQLEESVAASGLTNVVFTGRLPKERIPEALASVNACLVHLIKTDLFRSVIPSKIFEAAAMEKPIILGVEGFAARLVDEASAGICIEPENEKELIDAVQRLVDDPATSASMGANGREFVRRRYNYDLLAEKYIADLKTILDGS